MGKCLVRTKAIENMLLESTNYQIGFFKDKISDFNAIVGANTHVQGRSKGTKKQNMKTIKVFKINFWESGKNIRKAFS